MVSVLTGQNSFLLQAELKKRIDAFVAEYGDMGLEKLDGEEVDFARVNEALTSLPFLASKKLVVLRTPSAQKLFADKITDMLEGIPESTDVLIVEPKLDKRSVYYKTLKAKTELLEYNELDNVGLSRWLVVEAKSDGGQLTANNADYLVGRVGVNQQLLANELSKLLSYDPMITRETIDLLVEPTPQSTIFMLLDAAIAGNSKRALELYDDQRQQKIEPLYILAMLAWQLHILAVVKTGGEKGSDEIAAASKLNPFVVRKSLSLLKNVPLNTLKTWIYDLLQLDVRLKSESIDADEALQHYLLKLSQ